MLLLALLVSVVGFSLFIFNTNAHSNPYTNASHAASVGIFQFSQNDPNFATALSIAVAQEAERELNIKERVNLDEDFSPEDFGLDGVGMLPTNPFYFLKNARRGISSFFTFDAVKKTELKMQFASEKLMEVKALTEAEGVSEEDIKNALTNFEEEMARVKDTAEQTSEVVEGEETDELAKKIMDSIMKYNKSLGKIEKEISPESFEHISGVKQSTMETFPVVFDLSEPEKISEGLAEVLDEQKGS